MPLSFSESACISRGCLLPSQVVKTQPKFPVGQVTLDCPHLLPELPLALPDVI